MSGPDSENTFSGPSQAIAELRFAGIKSLRESLDAELKKHPDLFVKSEVRDSNFSESSVLPVPKSRSSPTTPATKPGIKTRILPIKLSIDQESQLFAEQPTGRADIPPMSTDRIYSKYGRPQPGEPGDHISVPACSPIVKSAGPELFTPKNDQLRSSRTLRVPSNYPSMANARPVGKNVGPHSKNNIKDSRLEAPVIENSFSTRHRWERIILLAILFWLLATISGYWLGRNHLIAAKNSSESRKPHYDSTALRGSSSLTTTFNPRILDVLDEADASAGLQLND